MHGLQTKRLENQHVQSALDQVCVRFLHHSRIALSALDCQDVIANRSLGPRQLRASKSRLPFGGFPRFKRPRVTGCPFRAGGYQICGMEIPGLGPASTLGITRGGQGAPAGPEWKLPERLPMKIYR